VSVAVEVLIVVVVTALVLLTAGAAAYVLVRRRWRRIRSHPATRGVVATLSVLSAWRDRLTARPAAQEVGPGPAARARRRMWAAINDAEQAVQHADALDAPVADLPAVCRSLRRVGGQLDHQLRLERRLPARQVRSDAVRAQAAEVIRAARDVQAAALGACSDATEPQIRALVRQARDEIEIVGSALSRLRSIAPR
jgi:hypothetical protein